MLKDQEMCYGRLIHPAHGRQDGTGSPNAGSFARKAVHRCENQRVVGWQCVWRLLVWRCLEKEEVS